MKSLLYKLESLLQNHPQLLKLYKNAGILFSGNVSSAIISLIALSVLTRALGLELFGSYALITAYISLIDRLVSFQTWQALIHFGSKNIENKESSRLTSLLAFGYSLDFLSGILGCVIAIIGIIWIPHLFGLDQIDTPILFITSAILFFNWVATPTAILRLFDKFYIQALYLNISATLKLFGYLALSFYGSQNLTSYISVWVFSTIIGRLFLFIVSGYEARRNGFLVVEHIDFQDLFQNTNGLWRFVLTTNLDGIVRILRDVDIFIVNALLGTSTTALYKIAREIARIPTQLTGPFYQAIYPELSKLSSAKQWEVFQKLMKQSSLSLGGLITFGWLGFIVIGSWFIIIVFGAEYTDAYFVAIWCIGAVTIWAFAQPLAPAMMALGQVQTNLHIHLTTSLAYIGILWFSASAYGLVGAGIALFLFYNLWSISMLFAFKRTIKGIIKNEV